MSYWNNLVLCVEEDCKEAIQSHFWGIPNFCKSNVVDMGKDSLASHSLQYL